MGSNGTQEGASQRLLWRRPDALAVMVLLLLIAVMMWQRWVYDNWLARHDLLTFFLPWFGALGDRLRSGDIPALNPSIFSGAPFAGDPESGWMYLPAMLLFPFFQLIVAYKLMILALLVIAGTSTYGLARVLGYSVLAALFTAVAFTFGPYLVGQTDCCTVGTQLGAFLPLAFLGVELGIRATTWPGRVAAWCVGGLAVSQMFAAWMGQGLANALILVAAWVVFRSLITPPNPTWGRWQRLVNMIWTGPAVMGTGVLLGAAGILPRLAANAESINPGGTYENVPGARAIHYHTLASALETLIVDNHRFRGSSVWGTVLAMMIVAVFVVRRHSVIPFFAVAALLIPALAMGVPGITDVFYLIPQYRDMQIHSPGRIFWIFPFVGAMLAGAGVNELWRLPTLRLKWARVVGALAVVVAAGWYETAYSSTDAGDWYWVSTVATTALVAVLCLPVREGAFLDSRQLCRGVLAALVALAFLLPNGLDLIDTPRQPDPPPGTLAMWGNDPWMQNLISTSLETTAKGGAGQFLQDKQATEEPFRFIAYGGMYHPQTVARTYPDRRLEPAMVAILQNERAMRLELETTQGYNPQQPMVYQQFMEILNRKDQDYHFANLLNTGVNSPLLDLLNVRYIVVDRTIPENRDDIVALSAIRTEVYQDDQVIIFESPTVMPRAWMVYDVRLAQGLTGVASIANGEVKGSEVAFIDDTLPPMAPITDGTKPQVAVTGWESDTLTMQVTQSEQGMLVVSQVYSENWHATVDGKDVPVVAADVALLGIPLGQGEHTVVLTYAPRSLTMGLWISAITGLACVGAMGYAGYDGFVRRRRTGIDTKRAA